MKKNMHLMLFAMTLTLMNPAWQSCNKMSIEDEVENQGQAEGQCQMTFQLFTPSSSRASSVADFKSIWVMDIVGENIVQIVEQKSTDPQFGSPTLTLVKGSHHLHFFATDATDASIDLTTIMQSPLGDSFFKSIDVDTKTTTETQRVILDRQVAKVSYVGEGTIHFKDVLTYFDLKTGQPSSFIHTGTLNKNDHLYTFIPASGYLTLTNGKKIPVKKNSVTRIHTNGENGGNDDGGNDNDNGGETPVEPQKDEIKILENDTAVFFVAKKEIEVKNLTEIPHPQNTFSKEMGIYRIPTRREALSLEKKTLDKSYWSDTRCLCFDSPFDTKDIETGTKLGSGKYYSFKWGSSATLEAGLKTKYCIKPIRSVAISPISHSHQIDANFTWDTEITEVE